MTDTQAINNIEDIFVRAIEHEKLEKQKQEDKSWRLRNKQENQKQEKKAVKIAANTSQMNDLNLVRDNSKVTKKKNKKGEHIALNEEYLAKNEAVVRGGTRVVEELEDEAMSQYADPPPPRISRVLEAIKDGNRRISEKINRYQWLAEWNNYTIGMAAITLILLAIIGARYGVIGMLYLACASVRALGWRDQEMISRWLTYWVVFALFFSFEIYTDFLLVWLPALWVFKTFFLLWCTAPMEANGSTVIYNNFIRPIPNFIHEKLMEAIQTDTSSVSTANLSTNGALAIGTESDQWSSARLLNHHQTRRSENFESQDPKLKSTYRDNSEAKQNERRKSERYRNSLIDDQSPGSHNENQSARTERSKLTLINQRKSVHRLYKHMARNANKSVARINGDECVCRNRNQPAQIKQPAATNQSAGTNRSASNSQGQSAHADGNQWALTNQSTCSNGDQSINVRCSK